MFSVSQERLILSLEEIRKHTCAYGPGAKTCDCKYINEKNPFGKGESTGCPELRSAYEIISHLTPEEFQILCKRAGLTLLSFED